MLHGVFRSLPLEPFAHSPIAHAQLCRDLPQAVALHLQLKNPLTVRRALRAAQLLAIRPRIRIPALTRSSCLVCLGFGYRIGYK